MQFADAQVTLNLDPLYAFRQEQLKYAAGEDQLVTFRLKPTLKLMDIKLWSTCYLRWISPVAVINGGPAAEYLTQCRLVEEIHSLRARISDIETNSNGSISYGNERRCSVLVFGTRSVGEDDLDAIADSEWNDSLPKISSSFPFFEWRQAASHSVDDYWNDVSFHGDDVFTDDLDDVESVSTLTESEPNGKIIDLGSAGDKAGIDCDDSVDNDDRKL